MRPVADECHIALGTLYNYFEDKDTLVLATVESIWQEIFHGGDWQADTFCGCVAELYDRARQGTEACPGFLTGHAIRIAGSRRGEARSAMEHTFAHMRNALLAVLWADKAVRQDSFTVSFSQEELISFVLDHMLILLVRQQSDCGALPELIRRAIYE